MSEELKPCPFCPDGGEPALFSETLGWAPNGENTYRAVAGCKRCCVGIELVHVGDDLCDESDALEETCAALEEEAVAKWNTRFERTCRIVEDRDWGSACSECGAHYPCMQDASYCPNCGRKVVE